MTTGTVLLLIILVLSLQIGLGSVVFWARQRRKCLDLKQRSHGNQPLLSSVIRSDLKIPNGADHREFKKLRVIKREMEDIAETACSFYLASADGTALPPFLPGQFLAFRIKIQVHGSADTVPLIRCYSLSDRPGKDVYRVTIKRLPPPADSPDAMPGQCSAYFHDHIQVGDFLSVQPPSGHFHLDAGDLSAKAPSLVLIGGGIGITPMLSMVESLLCEEPCEELCGNTRQDIWLFYGLHNGRDHIMKQRLQSLSNNHSNLILQTCYSQPLDSDRKGLDYQHRGHVDINLLKQTLPLKPHNFYICGPRKMMESLVPDLRAWGVAEKNIHYESFGPASLAKASTPTIAGSDQQKFTVTFSRSGRKLLWQSDSGSLLDLAESNGVQVESGCRAGSCGSCKTLLEEGELNYTQVPDADTPENHCLLCISAPASDLTLQA